MDEPCSSSQADKKSKSKNDVMSIDRSTIKQSSALELQDFDGLHAYDIGDLEKGVMDQVERKLSKMEENEKEKMEKQLRNMNYDMRMAEADLRRAEIYLESLLKHDKMDSILKRKIRSAECALEMKVKHLESLKSRRAATDSRLLALKMSFEDKDEADEDDQDARVDFNLGLDQRVTRGEMTPFEIAERKTAKHSRKQTSDEPKFPRSSASGRNFFDGKSKARMKPDVGDFKPRKQRFGIQHSFMSEGRPDVDLQFSDDSDGNDSIYDDQAGEWRPDEMIDEELDTIKLPSVGRKRKGKSLEDEYREVKKKRSEHVERLSGNRVKDDADFDSYEKRIQRFRRELLLRERIRKEHPGYLSSDEEDNADEECEELEGGFSVPQIVWRRLYPYQRIGVRWLWQLRCHGAGGILGDEMGLGKTIQMIAYLAGLQNSNVVDEHFGIKGLGAVLLVCPATVLEQWLSEFHRWWPPLRVAILHASGTGYNRPERLISTIAAHPGVLITTFSTLVMYREQLIKKRWHYVVLDEGHKIKNPNAEATIAAKQVKTPHRIILSGSPMQNNLKELWSLFDFVFPGKLGTLPDFERHFAVPIVQGGYSNANQIAVAAAYKCACVLRDTIKPYLIRRMKCDVNLQLPNKNEQVLFCRLTSYQREVYEEYLASKEVQLILEGKFLVFPGLTTMRKICNHPDISTGGPGHFDPACLKSGDPSMQYGWWQRAGKMVVVDALLRLWHEQGHKVLLFSQSQKMLLILEAFVSDMAEKRNFSFMRMDGGTPVSQRQKMVARFNSTPNIFIFLLTTRVGGLGLNLTGADRIIIYDPDWNPSTDMQARERAWRIGQKRDVVIYRLLTTGSIEEKIYHRQIFKQFLTNRVLKNPRQRRFFKANDLHELFSLSGDAGAPGDTETGAIFHGSAATRNLANRFDRLHDRRHDANKDDSGDEDVGNVAKLIRQSKDLHSSTVHVEPEQSDEEVKRKKSKKKKKSRKKESNEKSEDEADYVLSERKREKLRALARKINKKFSESTGAEARQEEAEKQSTDSSRQHKRKRSKRKKGRSASIEGCKIAGLDRKAVYDCGEGEDEDGNTEGYIMTSLVPEVDTNADLDYLTEREAVRVAAEAKRGLAKSAKYCRSAPIGQVTWTGSQGSTGKHREEEERRERENKEKRRRQKEQAKRRKKPDEFTSLFGEALYMKDAVLKVKKTDSDLKVLSSVGVESTLDHGLIVENETTDVELVDLEAEQVATAAVKWLSDRLDAIRLGEIKEKIPRFGRNVNYKICTDESSVNDNPNFGDARKAGKQTFFSGTSSIYTGRVSSLQLIRYIRLRRADQKHPASLLELLSERTKMLIEELRFFLILQPNCSGEASTSEIVNNFKSKIEPSENVKFRAILRKMCDYSRVNDVPIWSLQSRFR